MLGYDAYGRPYDRQTQEYWAKQGYYGNRSYDERYQNWQSQYYRGRGDENQQRQNTSAPEQTWPAETQAGSEGYQGSQGDTSFASEFHHQGGDTPDKYSADQSTIYSQDYSNQNASMGYRDQYGNSYGYGDGTDGYQEVKQVTPPPPERLTPAKFALPLVVARFSPGGHLIKVLPNMPQNGMPATVEIHSLETMLEHTPEAEELRAFPGPLIKGETHKSDVISFCQGKSSTCKNSMDMSDRDSASLLWDLMELLCRQNGNIMESDVSDLLLKNHPIVSSSSPATPASQTRGEEAAGEETNTEVQRSEVTTKRKPNLRDSESDTKRFRELLLFGRKKDAIEAAIKTGLWGHALLLACKMDSRTHTSVMTRFANSLPMNDPLQTLYQLMSNRQPAAVTSCADEKWGDWRPHLAMILSNLSQDSELDVKSIITLGDSLASRGLLKASHFVYLMAQVGFGVYTKKTTKMVLLGASHSLPFQSFALNDCIQQTEIYEYAQLLFNKQYTLPNYQPYKFIYATRLAEHGFTTQALSYCEVVANAVVYMPSLYSTTLVTQICQLASRLIYHDERYSDGQETPTPEWLNRLQDILNQMNEGQILPSSSSGTPMPWVESYSNLSNVDSGSVESTGPTFEVPSSEGKEPYTAVGDYQLNARGYYQLAAPIAGSANDPTQTPPNAYSCDQQQEQQQQLPQENTAPTTQYVGNYTFGQRHQPLSSLPQNLDPGASLTSNFSEYSAASLTSAGDSGTEFEDSGASKAAFDYYAASMRSGSFSQYGTTQAGNPPSPSDTLTPPATPGGRTRNYSADSTKHQQGEETMPEPQPEAKDKPKEKHKAKQGGGRGWFGGFFSKVVGRGNQVHLPDDSDKSIQWDEKLKKWVDVNADEDEAEAAPAAPPTDRELHSSVPQATDSQDGGKPQGPPGPPAMGDNKFRRPAKRNYVDVFQGNTKPAALPAAQPPSNLFQTLPTGPPAPNMNYFVPGPVADDTTDSNQQPQVGNPSSRSQTPASPAVQGDQSATNQQHQQQQQQQQQFFNPNAFGGNANSNTNATADQQQYQQNQYQQQHQQQQQQQQQQPPSMYPVSNTQPAQSQQEENNTQDEPPAKPSQPQPPPTQPAGPVFFNPQNMPAVPTVPSSGPARSMAGAGRRGYGARRQYPTTR